MEYYKGEILLFDQYVNEINESWIVQHRLLNPGDTITQKYCEIIFAGAFAYLPKDLVTEPFVVNYIEVVEDVMAMADRPELVVEEMNRDIISAKEKAKEKTDFIFLHDKPLNDEILVSLFLYPNWSDLSYFYGPNNPDHPITIFTYEGKLYKTLQDHPRQEDWLPTTAVSLYVEITPPGVIPAWKPPTGAHDVWPLGVQVTHNGHLWESGIDNNATVPGENPEHDYWIDLGVWPPQEPPVEPPANQCDSIAVWDDNEDYNQMEVGQLRKVLVNGVWKVYAVKNLGFVHYDPSGPNGHYGWTYQYDCPN